MDGLRDTVLDMNVTTNRPDCLGHLGIARELAAQFGLPLRRPHAFSLHRMAAVEVVEMEERARAPSAGRRAADAAHIEVRDAQGCPRYLARVIEGVPVGPSPEWARRRLRAVGVRALSNIVDATNYVLYEFGHPLHAFDLEQLAERRIVVRRAAAGEVITTLD